VSKQVRFRLGKLPTNRNVKEEELDATQEGHQTVRQRRIAASTTRAITKAVGQRQCGDLLFDLGFEVSHVTLAKGFRHAWVYWHATGSEESDDRIEEVRWSILVIVLHSRMLLDPTSAWVEDIIREIQ
jgi:ribosome-binding factor A